MSTDSAVSVIVPCYNNSDTLLRAFNSVVRQTRRPAEVIIVDDGSTDASTDVMRAIAEQHLGFVKLIYLEKNQGPSAARNAGWDAATQPYIAFLDADDAWHPQKLDIQYRWMVDHPEIDVTGHLCDEFQNNYADAILQEVPDARELFLSDFLYSNRISTPSVMLRREVPQRFPCNKRYSEDYELWLSVLANGGRVFRLESIMAWYFKAPFGASGLSADLWQMERGELGAYRRLFQARQISATRFMFHSAWGITKFLRRYAKVHVNKLWGGGWSAVTGDISARILASLWVFWFCVSASLSMIAQSWAVPYLVPHMHAGKGLIQGDASYYVQVAAEMATRIQQVGWGAWRVFDGAAANGHVAFLSALFAILNTDNPMVLIPFSAMAQATTGVILFYLGRGFQVTKYGAGAAFSAATAILILPTSMLWASQVSKDTFYVAGTLMYLLGWIMLWRKDSNTTRALFSIIGLAGLTMSCMVRPQATIIYVPIAIVMGGGMLVAALRKDAMRMRKRFYFILLMASVPLAMYMLQAREAAFYAYGVDASENATFSVQNRINNSAQPSKNDKLAALASWEWQPSAYIPESVDRLFSVLAGIRLRSSEYGHSVGAGSMIDDGAPPKNVAEFFAYAPRALIIGLFSPFPDGWLKAPSLIRWLSAIEMMVWYILAPLAIVVVLARRKQMEMWLAIIYSAYFLIILSFANTNIGTLYRVRYAYWAIIFILAAAGLAITIDSIRSKFGMWRLNRERSPDHLNRVIGWGGVIIIFMTSAHHFGFFLRDWLLARRYGLAQELDWFFLSMLLPTVLVNSIFVPIGQALGPAYLRLCEKDPLEAGRMALSLLMRAVIALAVLSLFLVIVAATLLGDDVDRRFIYAFIPILIVGGPVTMLSALLVAVGRPTTVVIGQMAVPVFTLTAIGISWNGDIVEAAVWGMGIGLGCNFVLNWIALRDKIFITSTIAQFARSKIPIRLGNQIWLLMLSNGIQSMIVPIGSLIALSVSPGSVAAVSYSSKIILFFSSIVGTLIAAGFVPQFSLPIAQAVLATSLPIIFIAASIFSFSLQFVSETIVTILFRGGAFGHEEVKMVASILSASIAQLPFFAAISVMARFAMAKRYERDVLASSVLSIILFVIVAVTGTNKFGIVAIGVAASIGMAGGAAFLSWSLYARCDIPKYVHESFILLSVGYGLVIGSVAGGQIFITCIFMIMWALMASRAWRRSLGDRGGEQQCAV